jgi:hypothetical protein
VQPADRRASPLLIYTVIGVTGNAMGVAAA